MDEVPIETWMIVLIMSLVLLGLVILYLRFMSYRREKRARFKQSQDRARKEGIVVPEEVAKSLAQEEDRE